MPTIVRRCGGFFARARHALPLLLELALVLLSGRAAHILLTDQLYFDRNPAAYGWLTLHLTAREWQLGLLAGAACALKAVGLVFSPARRPWLSDVAFVLRQVGWCASTAFWGLFAATWWAGNPGNLAASLAIFVAVFALLMMLAGPVMPEARADAE